MHRVCWQKWKCYICNCGWGTSIQSYAKISSAVCCEW